MPTFVVIVLKSGGLSDPLTKSTGALIVPRLAHGTPR